MSEPALKLVSERGPAPSSPEGTFQAQVTADPPKMSAAVRKDPQLRRLWREIVPALEKAGMVTASDSAGIEMALRHYSAAIAAADELASVGPTIVSDRSGTVRNPAGIEFRTQSDMFLKYAAAYGMTWSARMRTRVPEEAAHGEENPFS